MLDPFVTLILDRLAGFLEDRVKEEIRLVKGVKKEVRNLSIVLRNIQSVLNDAEKRKVEEETVRSWLEQLEDVLYDVDDVLDDLNTMILKKQILEDDDDGVHSPLEKVRCSLFHPCSCFKQLTARRRLSLRIRGLNARLNLIARERYRYNFVLDSTIDMSQAFRGFETSSLIDELEVFGRDCEKKSLIWDLLSGDRSKKEENPITVVSVVGTGGIGKTTLAQLAFNDSQVKVHFDYRIWVCVSDPFDEILVAKAIVESLTNSSPNLSRLDSLLRSIQDSLSKKRVLLVLDDVWSEDNTKWERLKPCLKEGAPGSRVLVTTRNEVVAKVMGASHVHRLGLLSDSDCWSLIRRIAFSTWREEDCEKFEEIGRLIAKRCKGLPLAAKTIGSLLLLKSSIEEWRGVLDSKIWELEKVEVELFPYLYLSYSHLAIPIRRCFKYCAVFPKDYEIDANELIRMWMAQGYLSSSRNGSSPEQRGRDYFGSLAMHSFFQDIRRDHLKGEIRCRMHDIVHGFAKYLMMNEYNVNNREKGKTALSSQTTCRHLTWPSSSEAMMANPVSNIRIEKLRTLFASNTPFKELPSDLFLHLTCVRGLTLHCCGLVEIPSEVAHLNHLRYLDLSKNPLKSLPETICNLCNLETLDLGFCVFLSALPERIGHLLNLRHLILSGTPILRHFPEGLMKLTALRTLSKFVVCKGRSNMRCLKDLNRLEGSMQIEYYGMTEEDSDDATEAKLRNKTGIKYLELKSFNGKVSFKVLEALQTPPELQQLNIWKYDGINFPDWLTVSLNNLKVLQIGLCINCQTVPPLWKLKSLETLKLEYMWALKILGLEFLGIHQVHHEECVVKTAPPPTSSSPQVVAFPKLKVLHFSWCMLWEKWEDLIDAEEISVSIMPSLRFLQIENCHRLTELPVRLIHMIPSLRHLNIENSTHLIDRYGYDATEWSGLPWRVSVSPKFRGLPSSRNTIFTRLHRAGGCGGPLDRTRSI